MKKTYKKAVIYLKHYWYVPVIFLIIVFLSIASKEKAARLIDILKDNRKNYDDAVRKLDKVKEKQIHKTEEINKQKEAEVINLDKARDKQIEQIEKDKNKEIDKLKTKPTKELSDKLKKEFEL